MHLQKVLFDEDIFMRVAAQSKKKKKDAHTEEKGVLESYCNKLRKCATQSRA